jgi:pimeloyl-ACP methyl ester carboxylesterase
VLFAEETTMSDSNETLHEIWYESAGTRLFAVERGRGPAVVFLHGGLADHQAAWFRLGPLASSHRLVTPDVRGAGRSHHAGELSWDQLADDVVALLRHLGLPRAVVGGTSAGSAVALRLALRHPERVAALLLVSPVFAGEHHDLGRASRAAMARMNEAGQRAPIEGIAAIHPLFEPLPLPIRERALAMVDRFDPRSVAATTAFLASGAEPFARLAELAALTMPVLVVPGTDPEHPAEVAALYAKTIPHATLADPSEELAPLVERFLRNTEAST